MALLPRKRNATPATAQAVTPQHVAIIMDGNGRWAKSRGLPRTAGHKKGADTLRTVLNACREAGVKYLTIYAFSSENWQRPEAEVSDLMQLLRHYLENEIRTMHENGVRMRFIGNLAKLAPDIRDQVHKAETLTQENTEFNLTVALSYGGRQELVRAAQKLATEVAQGIRSPEAITEKALAGALDTHDLPEPDLLIRTGGEQRISNFLLWQSAYAEFYFTPVLWPDFSAVHFREALEEYSRRERRYGTAPEN
jgi:undecaprenyl diphosphate synthase